ncbi:MAG: SRPBCC family protein [Hyphomonadaceae bacterium]
MASHDLKIELILDAPREKLYRGWTEPELMKQWFAPKPWTTPKVVTDVRPGGASTITMASPEGQEMPNPGQWLEVIPNRKLVFTDAFTGNWVPKDGVPFFVAEINFEDAGPGKTKYTAIARHWTAETKAQHEQMGFVPGWTQCARQLEELAKTL